MSAGDICDGAKVISCVRRERGITGKMATDGTREPITVVETISGDGVSLLTSTRDLQRCWSLYGLVHINILTPSVQWYVHWYL